MSKITDMTYTVLRTVGALKVEDSPEVVRFLRFVSDLPTSFSGKDRCMYAYSCANEYGQFPTEKDYAAKDLPLTSGDVLGSMAGVLDTIEHLTASIKMDSLNKQFMQANNESTDYDYISDKMSEAIEGLKSINSSYDNIDITPIVYTPRTELSEGIKSGVPELDKLTMGWQRTTIATVAAFTGHGKSTFLNSMIYNAASEGRKIVLFSLELSREIAWACFEQRWNWEHGVECDRTEFTFRALNNKRTEGVLANQEEYQTVIASNIAVIDESSFENKKQLKAVLSDYTEMNNLLESLAKKLGGLDMVCIDHVGQIDLMFGTSGNKGEFGNRAIKTFQSSAKTFKDQRDISPVFIQAVQCNREGYKRALTHNGQYLLTAIGDLNEVERSSSYVVFLYTDEDDKACETTRMTLTKNRLGQVFTEPIAVPFLPQYTKVGNDFSLENSGSDMLGDSYQASEGDLF